MAAIKDVVSNDNLQEKIQADRRVKKRQDLERMPEEKPLKIMLAIQLIKQHHPGRKVPLLMVIRATRGDHVIHREMRPDIRAP